MGLIPIKEAKMQGPNESPTKYEVLCPWCQAKGRRTRVGWSTVEGSSGICDECLGDLREEAGMEREPDRGAEKPLGT